MRGWQWPGLLLAAGFAFSDVYGLPVFDSVAFLAAVLAMVYLPGALLLRQMVPELPRDVLTVFLGLGVGTALLPLAYLAIRFLAPGLGTLLILTGLVLGAAFVTRAKAGKDQRTSPAGASGTWFAWLALLVAFALAHGSHFRDLELVGDGWFLNTHFMTESVFHLGIVNSLADGPLQPGLYMAGAEQLRGYHIGLHLQVEFLARLTGVDTLTLTYFYVPLLYLFLIVGLTYGMCRRLGGSVGSASVACLLPFAAGLSFIPGLLRGADPDIPWTIYFLSPVPGIFTLNGLLAAIPAFLVVAWLLRHFLDRPGHRLLGLLGLMLLGVYLAKSSSGLQLAACLGLLAFVLLVRGASRDLWLKLGLLSVVTLVGMFALQFLVLGGTGHRVVEFSPFAVFGPIANRLVATSSPGLQWLAYAAAILAVVGVRVLGLFSLRNLDQARFEDRYFVNYLVLVFVSGLVLGDFVHIGGEDGRNNGRWFAVQSLLAGSMLVVVWLARLELRSAARAGVFAMVLVLAGASTVQYFHARSRVEMAAVDASDLQIVQALRATPPGSVVLHPLNPEGPSLASHFAGRPSVLNVFRTFVRDVPGSSERASDLLTFADEASTPEERARILARLGVDYVYWRRDDEQVLDRLPALKPVEENDRWVLFAVE